MAASLPGPEVGRGAKSLALRRHPDRLRQPEARIPDGRAVSHVEAEPEVGRRELVPDDSVSAGQRPVTME